MHSRHYRFDYSSRAKRRQKLKLFGVPALIIAVIAVVMLFFSSDANDSYNERDLVKLWQDGSYIAAFEISERELQKKPMDFFLLMIHGFSAYQIAVAQITTFDMLAYIERSVWALRNALLTKQGENDARIKYALGRSYHYKGAEYADLCIQYLEESRASGYKAEDIPQFLGLAYAEVHDWEQSIAAFSEALSTEANSNSDLLLLAISRSYIEMEDTVHAKPYIIRAIEISKDWNIISQARLLFAGVMMKDGDLSEAEAQIRTVLAEGGDSAEAHYQLGLLYEVKKDAYRSRAEWRRAFNLNPDYAPVREKLNL